MNRYYLYGIMIPVIAAIILYALKQYLEWNAARKNLVKPCPHCREMIHGSATVCKHCQRDV